MISTQGYAPSSNKCNSASIATHITNTTIHTFGHQLEIQNDQINK